MSNKPPKIVIPGMNRGAGIPGGYILGRRRGSKQGPVELLNLAQVGGMGIATTQTVTDSTSTVQSIAHSETQSLSKGISTSLSGAVSSVTSLSSAVSTVISGSISAVNSRVDSLSTAVGGGGGVDDDSALSSSLSSAVSINTTQSTSLSQISSSLSGAISSTTSLSTAVNTVDSNQTTSLSQISSSLSGAISSTGSLSVAVSTVISGSVSAVNSRVDSLSTAVGGGGGPDPGQSTSLSQISSSLSGAISSTTSLSTAVSTVDSNQSTSLSQISSSLSGANSSTTSLSTAVSSVNSGQSTSLSQISNSLSDTPTIEAMNAAIAAATGSGGTVPDGVVSGCGVFYSGTGLTFNMSAGSFYIDNTLYTAAAQSVTLSAADATNPRIDVLYVDSTGTFGKITGTAAASPSQPSVDPTTQLYLTFVLVPATATSISGITNENIYLEGVEWTGTTSGSGFTLNSTNNPYAGTKDIEGTTVTAASYVKLVRSSSMSFDGSGNLTLQIRSKALWSSRRWLTFQWYLAGIAKGSAISLKSGTFGFDSSITSGYQLIVIPKTQFVVPSGTNVDELRIVDVGGSIGFYLDNIVLQNTGTSSGGTSSSGITQDQADARYARRSNNLSDLGSVATARTNLGVYSTTETDAAIAAGKLVYSQWFGDGSDSDVTISSGTTILTRDMYYHNLTISGTGALNTAAFRVFVSGTLDITAAPAAAIFAGNSAGTKNGTAATNASAGAAGTNNQSASDTIASSGSVGAIGAGGTTGAGTSGTLASSASNMIGGLDGASGKGGGVGATAGGAAQSASAATSTEDMRRLTLELMVTHNGTLVMIKGGAGAPGGSSGAGDGVGTGGGGGGGGAGGGVTLLAAKTINRGGSTAAGAISVKGGNGGTGASGGAGGTNRGGGGGGAGGGGGWLILIYNTLTGSTATNCLDASGGDGGAGGNGVGTGVGGDSGFAGGGGRIHVFDLGSNTFTVTETTAAVTGNAASAGTGGLAKTNTSRVSL